MSLVPTTGYSAMGPLPKAVAESLFNGRNELLGNSTAGDLILELERIFAVGFDRCQGTLDVSVLTRTTRLLLVLVIELDFLGRTFAVADLGSTDDRFRRHILATNSSRRKLPSASSPIPLIRISPVSSSLNTLNVGSSLRKRCRRLAHLVAIATILRLRQRP